jgi:dihydrodipicolinate synthase/N-acetylneuraminate lyase
MRRTAFARGEAKAAARELLRGSVAAPCLPVDEHGDIDEAGLRHDIRHCIDVLGSTGLYINGTFQHYWLLTVEQRRRVVEIAVDEVDGVVPIINRCAHTSPRQAIELAQHTAELGVPFIDLVPPDPQFVGADPHVLVRYYTTIAEQTELGVILFHTPGVGYTMSPELLAELAEIPNVCGIDNGMPLDHTNKVRDLVGDSVLVVDPIEDRCLVNMLEYGQQVIFTGDSPMFDSAADQPLRRYIDAALAGRAAEAARIFEALEPVRDVHRRWVQDRWTSSRLIPVGVIKYWAAQLGMTGGPTPRPLPSLTAEEMDELRAELVFVGLVSE